jgi:hypothetical protein
MLLTQQGKEAPEEKMVSISAPKNGTTGIHKTS